MNRTMCHSGVACMTAMLLMAGCGGGGASNAEADRTTSLAGNANSAAATTGPAAVLVAGTSVAIVAATTLVATAVATPKPAPQPVPDSEPPLLASQTKMVLKSLDGPVLAQEIDSFKGFITSLVPAADNIGNAWAQGDSGRELKAMGMVYELSGDVKILQKMIGYCDALLAERNDLAPAPVGQHKVWTGTIAPVWPNEVSAGVASAGAEQGDAIGHLGYCAKLILKSPTLAALAVPGGDPHGYGRTYRERAKTYVRECDRSVKEFILPKLLAFDSNGLYRFSMASPYKTGLAVPWNQQMMLNYAFMNLADAHHLLKDAAADEKMYRQMVAVNIKSFFTTGTTSYRNKAGRQSYNWGYTLPAVTGEDGNHGALDVAGLYRAFDDGSYGVTATQMNTLANTFVDVMILGPKKYAGQVDGTSDTGHAAETTYIRSAYLLLAQFRPDAYQSMMSADLTVGTGTGAIDVFATALWLKKKRAP